MSSARSIDEVHRDVYRALRDAGQALERKRGDRRAAMTKIFADLQEGEDRNAAVLQVLQAMLLDVVDELEKAMSPDRNVVPFRAKRKEQR